MPLRRGVLALSLVAFAASAAARPSQPTPEQAPPVDPVAIAFDISVDHDAEDAAGPKLLKYVIDFVPAAGAPGRSHTLDLGKPTPVEGSISVPLTNVLQPGSYNAHVRAIGRGLHTTSVTVGPFVITDKAGKTNAEAEPDQDGAKPAGKPGFWKKFYEKVVGDPPR